MHQGRRWNGCVNMEFGRWGGCVNIVVINMRVCVCVLTGVCQHGGRCITMEVVVSIDGHSQL